MVKLLIAAPTQVMYDMAMGIVSESGIEATVLRVSSDNVVNLVKAEFAQDTGVVVARGNHAHLLKSETQIPVVDIVLSGQELANLLERACRMIPHGRPRIALVGFRYMFSNPEPIARILNADVDIYYASGSRDIPDVIEQTHRDKKELVIGGELACAQAERLGMMNLFLDSQPDSIRSAVRTAAQMLEALRIERHKSAEFMYLLNYSFDVIVKLSADGTIVAANYLAEKAFRVPQEGLIGRKFLELPGLDVGSALREALEQQKSLYSCVVRIDQYSFVAKMACLELEESHTGFIITMQEFSVITNLEEQIRLQRRNRGYVATSTFAEYATRSPAMATLFAEAEQLAQYDVPILIAGPAGAEFSRLAQAIHNSGLYRQNPFVPVDLSAIPPADQLTELFGADGERNEPGLIEYAQKGTIFFQDVDQLSLEAQRQLLSLLRHGQYRMGARRMPTRASVRVICSTGKDLAALSESGAFLDALYRALAQLRLDIPPLSRHPEDILPLLDQHMALNATQYKKNPLLGSKAIDLLLTYHWPGDVEELKYFCKRAVLLTTRSEVDDEFVRSHLLPAETAETEGALYVVASPEERELRKAFAESAGDLGKTAERLRVSRTTLWRRMKKYGMTS